MPYRIFVTGGSGYLGSAIAARLARAGHAVQGLARDSARAATLQAIGVHPVLGTLDDPRTFTGAIRNCDAVVHAARGEAALDLKAIDAVRAAAEDGRVRRLLYTSGAWVHGPTGGAVADETAPLRPLAISAWRVAHEDLALDLGQHEVHVTVLRPVIVYGESRGIIGALFAEARDRRTVTVPGDGTQHWGLVHRGDVAEAYALALEHARGGERYLLDDGASQTAGEVGAAIARVTGAETRLWPHDEVVATLGPYGEALLASIRTTSARARRDLGWVPRHGAFVEGVDGVFREWMASQGSPVG
jgi:nucleoside-diphosphate-sugar epimerase